MAWATLHIVVPLTVPPCQECSPEVSEQEEAEGELEEVLLLMEEQVAHAVGLSSLRLRQQPGEAPLHLS